MNIRQTLTVDGRTIDLDVSKHRKLDYKNPIWIVEVLDMTGAQIKVCRICCDQDQAEDEARDWTERLLRLNPGVFMSWTIRQAFPS